MKIPENCLECDEGCYQIVAKPYESRGQDGNVVAVPNVKFLVCTDCGEELIPAESVRYISRFVAEANDQITKEELYAMLDATGLSQKDFAEAIGLGEKTVHRWLKGTQVVSRSMGYYLRAMKKFPDVFDWIKARDWRKPAPAVIRVSTSGSVQTTPFTALARRSTAANPRFLAGTRGNPARTLMLKAVHYQ